MTLKEAEVLALSTLKQVMEEKVGGRVGGCCRRHTSSCARMPLPCLCLPTTRLPPKPCTAAPAACRLPQVTATNVDIARVAPKWHLYTPAEVEEVIARL
jgi:hypothetical protein